MNIKLRFEHMLLRYLRKRGWIVFWLDNPVCAGDTCWLRLYIAEQKRSA